MPAPSTDTPGVRAPLVRRPAGVSRLGLAMASLATAGTFAVALIGLGGPPAPVAPTMGGVADATTADAVVPPSATPVAAAPKAVSSVLTRVVTSQSGSGGTKGGEQEGND
jgi:small neutral amino acid transporter SnatA (MarC family)